MKGVFIGRKEGGTKKLKVGYYLTSADQEIPY